MSFLEVTRMHQDTIHTGQSVPSDISAALKSSQIHLSNQSNPPYIQFKEPAETVWQPFGTHISIGGNVITGGLFYFGRKLPARDSSLNDPCLITPDAPIAPGLSNVKEATKTNHPSWVDMTPTERGAFIAWMAASRNDRNASDSTLFLYLFGLERRLLIDGPRDRFSASERMIILREIKRLLSIYGDRHPFAESARHILSIAWANTSNPKDGIELPEEFDLRSNESACIIPFYLASFAAQKQPIPALVMYEWYMRHPDCKHPAAGVQNHVFRKLFCDCVETKYPDGYPIPASQKSLCLHYDAINPALGILDFEYPEIPDIFTDAGTVEILNQIGNQCASTLNEYLKYLKQPNSNAVGALLMMPIKLRQTSPALKNLGVFLQKSTANGVGSIRVKDIFRALGLPVPASLDRTMVKDIGRMLEISCYQFAPNITLHGTGFGIDDKIFLTPSLTTPELTKPFAILSVILRLGAIIAQCDEDVSQPEIDVLQKMIMSRKILNDEQRASLLLWLHWCLSTPQQINDIQHELSGIDEELRDRISKVLIKVACADGVIDPRERQNLVTLHKALGLPESWVDLELSTQNGIQIPKCNNVETPKHEEVTSKRTNSAADLAAVEMPVDLNKALSSICENAPEVSIQKIFMTKEENAPLLDSAHRAFLAQISQHTSWPRFDFFETAISFHLMADRAMQKINQASTIRFGTEIITDGDIVNIDTELAKHLSLS